MYFVYIKGLQTVIVLKFVGHLGSITVYRINARIYPTLLNVLVEIIWLFYLEMFYWFSLNTLYEIKQFHEITRNRIVLKSSGKENEKIF